MKEVDFSAGYRERDMRFLKGSFKMYKHTGEKKKIRKEIKLPREKMRTNAVTLGLMRKISPCLMNILNLRTRKYQGKKKWNIRVHRI